jgi:hypothetical protein
VHRSLDHLGVNSLCLEDYLNNQSLAKDIVQDLGLALPIPLERLLLQQKQVLKPYRLTGDSSRQFSVAEFVET